jgi:SEC-C motif-containing protein
MICPCSSGKLFSECCEPFILTNNCPESALACMRSRYSAYVLGNIDYLISSTVEEERKYYSKKEIERWSKESTWLKLEIIAHSEKHVEFKAYYQDILEQIHIHHEKSNFIYRDKCWFYKDGENG